MSIIEENLLIAEFLGLEWLSDHGCAIDAIDYIHIAASRLFNQKEAIENFEFHTSWDWLMPVVEKIERMKQINGSPINFNIGAGDISLFIIKGRKNGEVDYMFSYFEDGYDENDSKIGAVYKAVVKFIKWYNESQR